MEEKQTAPERCTNEEKKMSTAVFESKETMGPQVSNPTQQFTP